MSNNLNGYLLTIKLPCSHCEGRGVIVHPLRQAYQDLVADQPKGRPNIPTFGSFAQASGICDPDHLPQEIACPRCYGEKWERVTDIPVSALPLVTDELKALSNELDNQVGALGKTLEEVSAELITLDGRITTAGDDAKQVWTLWDLVREHEARLDRQAAGDSYAKQFDATHQSLTKVVNSLQDQEEELVKHQVRLGEIEEGLAGVGQAIAEQYTRSVDQAGRMDRQDLEAGRARTDISRLFTGLANLEDSLSKILAKQSVRLEGIEANFEGLNAQLERTVPADADEHRKLMDAEHCDMVRRIHELEDFRAHHMQHQDQTHSAMWQRLRTLETFCHTAGVDILHLTEAVTRKANRKPAPRRKAKRP